MPTESSQEPLLALKYSLDFTHPGLDISFGVQLGASHVQIVLVRTIWDDFCDEHELVATEITKCEVVCSNCHRVRTAERRAA